MADDLSAAVEVNFSANKEGGAKYIEVETAATADHTDYFSLTLADYGATKLKAIRMYRHTTDNSVVVDDDAPTTVVTAGVLTVTIGGSTGNKKRFCQLWVS